MVVLAQTRGLINTGSRRDFDPTRTITLRSRFVTAMDRRFKHLLHLLNLSVEDNDCFALKGRLNVLQTDEEGALGSRAYEFRRDADKVTAFGMWLEEMISKEILEVTYIISEGRIGLWADTYVLSAYQKGLMQARADLRAAGARMEAYDTVSLSASLNAPVNAERLALIYTRDYTDLKGVTDAMSSQISRTLAQGLAEGVNPNEMARRMTKNVENVGINRARTIARTEVINTYNSAALSEYAAAEAFMGKEVKVQWWTARDERVCNICAPRHGKIYTRTEAQVIMSPHPNCRCALLPYMESWPKKEEK